MRHFDPQVHLDVKYKHYVSFKLSTFATPPRSPKRVRERGWGLGGGAWISRCFYSTKFRRNRLANNVRPSCQRRKVWERLGKRVPPCSGDQAARQHSGGNSPSCGSALLCFTWLQVRMYNWKSLASIRFSFAVRARFKLLSAPVTVFWSWRFMMEEVEVKIPKSF